MLPVYREAWVTQARQAGLELSALQVCQVTQATLVSVVRRAGPGCLEGRVEPGPLEALGRPAHQDPRATRVSWVQPEPRG